MLWRLTELLLMLADGWAKDVEEWREWDRWQMQQRTWQEEEDEDEEQEEDEDEDEDDDEDDSRAGEGTNNKHKPMSVPVPMPISMPMVADEFRRAGETCVLELNLTHTVSAITDRFIFGKNIDAGDLHPIHSCRTCQVRRDLTQSRR